MGSLSIWHWLIIAVVFVMFFGAKRMPDAARSLGRSLRIFKSEVSQMHNESNASDSGASAQQPAPQLPAGQQPTPSVTEPRTEQKSV
ncbi:Sec-independent protein translocase subunit TatA [Nocardia gipuzkoensis]|jgi:sec-independent protein translocase protein TatA|uniref:Sec-independent protein translocase subunit TatA n=1 Tax=Nocardia TaxID=1817 RepID=UPI0015EE70B5|nr:MULTISPECIES: Sec-independent protein translocase subunit TatA [Nocardia]MBF6220458.1 Sec-independent protein translocase subunit TatA [Nocardia abscessus]MBF6474524.1 Sec-independent protein translocase subunit TatA [Nocardia abscessus]MDE1669506.1 Sec-independent protein translocase subunit TatA [Nocardia gipuzkoensis]